MFGHKTQAEAVVIMREKLHESAVEHGSNHNHWHYQTWRFVVEVRPPGGAPYRAGVEQKIRVPGFVVPAAGDTVRVEYPEKDPSAVELALEGDDRYDVAASEHAERERHKAGQAGRDAAFEAALDAPPGTPPGH